MGVVDIIWFKERDSNTSRPPYMSIWRYKGEFYQVFWPGEKNYEALAPVLDLIPFAPVSYNCQSYEIEESELASILGDGLGYVTFCDKRSEE